jgi:hypothetical protein
LLASAFFFALPVLKPRNQEHRAHFLVVAPPKGASSEPMMRKRCSTHARQPAIRRPIAQGDFIDDYAVDEIQGSNESFIFIKFVLPWACHWAGV